MARSKLTTESFIARATEVHAGTYDYSITTFKASLEKLEIVCKKHGSFWQMPYGHLAGHGCNQCRSMSLEDFIKRAKVTHGDSYVYGNVIMSGMHSKVDILCPTHGSFAQTPNSHINGIGCRLCGNIKLSESKSISQDDFLDRAVAVHGDRYDYSEVVYTRSPNKIKVICKDHGVFTVTPNNHLRGKACGKCVPGGFQPQFAGYVYVLKSESKVKVGITNKDPNTRLKHINYTATSDVFELVHSRLFESGYQAQVVENILLLELRSLHETDTSDKFNGYTECFVGADVDSVVSRLINISI